MPYSDLTFTDLEEKFGLQNQRKHLFQNLPPVEPSEKLKVDLLEAEDMSLKSEKARSEWIVVPILRELPNRNDKFITIYSGEILNADKEKGLTGECDFIIAKETWSYDISVPIFQLVEAKNNDLEEGVRQCAAQMMGTRVFNQKKGIELEKMYGCSTTAHHWQFLELSDKFYIDMNKYNLKGINKLLGVFQHIITYYRQQLPDNQATKNI